MFMDDIKETLNEEFNVSVTENGAVGYRTTGKELLDMNFAISSMRNMREKEIVDRYVKVFYEDKLLAVKWLFYVRDIRGGVGERRLFRICMKYLAENHREIAKATIELVSEYGRWDDLLCLLDTGLRDDVVAVFDKQITKDMENMQNNKSVSLLAKWLPSPGASSCETKRLAGIVLSGLGLSEKQYRKMLSKIRAYLKIVEVDMSKKEWSNIDYSAVPSRANLIYNNAFLRNDEERRRKYLESLQKGETKINSGVLFPHDIVNRYMNKDRWVAAVDPIDNVALEEMWKELPDYVNGAGNTICVADGSASMTTSIGTGTSTALDVANALAIYFAERSFGQFKNTYITFSEHPRIVNLGKGKSLREKIEIALAHNEITNTNIEAVFDLILTTAVEKKMSQDELPQNILILSDMEFDGCVTCFDGNWHHSRPTQRLFKTFEKRYAEHGYKLPRLVFWNICGRTGTIPVKENDLGVALVSGFSPAVMKMVLSNSVDPFECLLEQVNSERYAAVEEAVKDLVV